LNMFERVILLFPLKILDYPTLSPSDILSFLHGCIIVYQKWFVYISQEVRYNVTLNEENEHDFTCPNNGHSEDKVKYAENIRNQVLLKSQDSCSTKKSFAFSSNK
jgi:hypothetical protein